MGGSAGKSADINAALVAQAARGPDSAVSPVAAETPAASSPFVAGKVATPAAVQPSLFTGVSPYRQAGSTTLSTAQRPTLSMPGMQGVQNPFYTAPRAPTSQAPQVSALASQYQTYQQQQANQLAAAAAQRKADAFAAQQAYETARGNTALRNQYEGTISSLQNQLAQAQANQYSGGGDYNGWYGGGGAAGGIADLEKGFK